MLFESNVTGGRQNNIVQFIINKYGLDFFKQKRILELAPCNGAIGKYFFVNGAHVTMVEGNQSSYENLQTQFSPKIKVIYGDLEEPEWAFGSFDIILNFGLFYHLRKNHLRLLENCINNCDVLFLETEVFDSFDIDSFFERNEKGVTASIHCHAKILSWGQIEHNLNKFKVFWKRYDDSSLNDGGHVYDWIHTNSNVYKSSWNRSFYIISKENESLIK